MTTSQKLLHRLIKDLPELQLNLTHRLRKIPRGRHGRSAGQFAWCIVKPNGIDGEIGSEDTMTECLKADELTFTKHPATRAICICAEVNSKS